MRSRRLHTTGERIANRYEILDFAGEGGMQEVYLAQDLHLKRRVAVKTPKNASADKRFERSAIVSAQVITPMLLKLLTTSMTEKRNILSKNLLTVRISRRDC